MLITPRPSSISSESLLHPRRHRSQISINLSRRTTQNQTNNRRLRNTNILEATQNVDLGIGEHDSRSAGVLNGEFSLAVFACNTADCATHVFALEGFDVFDFEGLDVEIVESEEGDCLLKMC